MNFLSLKNRHTINKYTKYKQEGTSAVTNLKKEKLYEYYLCDYCNKEIIIKNKKHEMSGGVCVIPQSLTKRSCLKLVLHNKCLNAAIAELEG